MSWIVPPRQQRAEILDDPRTPWTLRERSHRDIACSNRWLGGDRALAVGIDALVRDATQSVTVLDLGAGLGGAGHVVRRVATRARLQAHCIGLDVHERLARVAARREGMAICANALALPLHDRAVDVTICALLLHHFDEDAARQLLREAVRVSRIGVVVADLQRTRLAEIGLWLASFPLGFHPVSRHDGMLSVRRAFTVPELAALLDRAGGCDVHVTKRAGFRLVGTCRAPRVPSASLPA
ncbi:MAG: methyltransferase domain-containing protein [Gemmatimonadetes bacterium]|nr:methyltransferase domain-containing protein [Gemmatimonadota bacterium]